MRNGFSEEDCINALRKSKEQLGETPTIRQYQTLDISPSASTIVQKFGSWNGAKEEAGLEKNPVNNKIHPKPDSLDLPEDKIWEKMSPYQRYYYKNRESEKKRTKERIEHLKEWFSGYKKNFECEECGEGHPACLDFHHPGKKEIGVSELILRKHPSKERIKKEIQNCKVLCANCHRKHHRANQ
ncbi:MAG: homing endonuclease associated repeat-containing protein [Candidatus Aenigmatarchaeota archaeon]